MFFFEKTNERLFLHHEMPNLFNKNNLVASFQPLIWDCAYIKQGASCEDDILSMAQQILRKAGSMET